jgi:molybdopterin/thiamine biosynthesis adenylyltransferase/molybdopterin synthase catalytic subunit/rhodanese-related sulfurtransferase
MATTFQFSPEPIDPATLRGTVADPACGGYASFEGWVRECNDGREVQRLEYEAFAALAIKEGERIIAEAIERFGIARAACVHRLGTLEIGEIAVWVGASAAHRHEAFLACRYIIDAVKHRLPIWKKEHYRDGDSGWVNCERCGTGALEMHPETHAHAAPVLAPTVPDYSRQSALREVGASGQARLGAARALIVGCGGLGVPAMSYLAGAGIGRLGLVDADVLEASNLHRQPLYALRDCGRPKVQLAAERLRALNPAVDVRTHPVRLDANNAAELVADYDIIIECTDNIAAKLALSDACIRGGKPAVFASVYQYEGQLQIVQPGGPCLRCVWPEAVRDGLVGTCAEAGVLGPVPGTLGTLQALEALKLLLDLPGQLTETLLIFDLLTLSISRIRTRRSLQCPQHALAGDRTPSIANEALELEFESLHAASEAGYLIVDIRERHEQALRPAAGVPVHSIPMTELLYGGADLPPASKYLLVCAAGQRSLAAAQELRARGPTPIFSLRGGLAALGSKV